MIQRKQTLFLLQIAFLSVCLLFVPIQFVTVPQQMHVTLMPLGDGTHALTLGHLAAITLNALGFILSMITIFLYKRRELQVKLTYVLMIIYLVLPLMMAFCPFIQVNTNVRNAETNVFGYIISGVCVLSAFLAARFIKSDIELIKSSDRIR